MSEHTNKQIAESYTLWGIYIDTNNEMSKEEFDGISVNSRMEIIMECGI